MRKEITRKGQFVPDHIHDAIFMCLVSRVLILCLVIACSKYNMADGMRQMFDPFERVARAHHFCPCCERPFSSEEEDNFVKKVDTFHILLNIGFEQVLYIVYLF